LTGFGAVPLVHLLLELDRQEGLTDLAAQVLLAPTREFFTTCWVMVEPPWLAPPLSRLASTARMDRPMFTPLCS
jgi:hypothetical protein